ncbi:heat shock-related 70 kDa protein 2-like [Frankliniella occidentalis]|uniref:Heat shock-related 70 kDa protein 2-like n=1 Tax=Frankliniella occidentalis TaxID=133901 RepID=A0A6J1T541_FRAOC|nr:heat shock-related 70 kDa protein 2-like [Frankliniella occidentalis]
MSLRDDLDLPDGDGVAVGIDLGTTYSVVGVCRRRKVEILANDNGSRTTPSIVGFLDGQSFVGDAAKDLPAANQVFDAKRLVGRQWSDRSIQEDKSVWPFEVEEHGGVPRIRVKIGERNDTFAPEEISAMVLRDLKKTAEAALGQSVSKAVVTVPAYFNERQRQATKDACRIAGLEVLAMINEPTAAAIAYGLDNKKDVGPSKTVFIFDLGGGTFDVSVMKISGSSFQVLASGGDTHLGGQDFDVLLLEHCLEDLKKTLTAAKKKTLMQDKQAMQDLRQACELVKRKLSTVPQAPLSVFLSRLNKGYQTTISRSLFENVCSSLFLKTIQVSEKVLTDAKVTRGDIDEVVLVGGSTRIPKVRALLRDMFGGKELRQSINPDEAVAYGAAVHAAVLTGDKFFDGMVKLRDVTPLSLGVFSVGGKFSRVIKRNTPIPCKNTRTYVTFEDNQLELGSKIYQGERPLVKDNYYLNKEYRIAVPRLPAGQAKTDVTFEIDASGLLTVTCVETTSGRQVQVRVTPQEAYLSEDDIQAMIEKARRLRREDQDALREVNEDIQRKRQRLS